MDLYIYFIHRVADSVEMQHKRLSLQVAGQLRISDMLI